MPNLKIRKAKSSDARPIYVLGKRIHQLDFSSKYPFHELSEIKEFISAPKENVVLVAEYEGRIVGFVVAKILAHSAGGWCMLDNLGVDPKHRRKGLGNRMLKALYNEIKARKIKYVQILESKNKQARRFWKKEGFKETKTFIWAEKTIR
jgi:ribosomal protein S18 acetylase RimI-like enzyme